MKRFEPVTFASLVVGVVIGLLILKALHVL